MIVGWYVHHHGAGHLARLRATLEHVDGDVVALSSLEAVAKLDCDHLVLPADLSARPVDATANGTLHWVPLGHDGLRERMAAIAAWIAAARPDVMVVDVSVEVALLARLHGVRVVIVAQRGRRTDAPHALAYAQAAAVVAPWTAATHLDEDRLPEATTRFVGAISRFDASSPARGVPSGPVGDVLLVLGAGGHEITAAQVLEAAGATPQRTWHIAGPVEAHAPNVVAHGARADVARLLAQSSVVVGSAGANVVAEIATSRRPYVCLPQARPFDEQLHQAEALRRLGVAEVRHAWPAAHEWPALLAAAEARDTGRWALLHDGGGARRLAATVREVV